LVYTGTNRADAACRYYSFTPRAVDDNTILSVIVTATWGPQAAGLEISLGRVTFYLQPTDTPVSASMGLETSAEEAHDEDIPNPIP
jgi:hypothetical protein